MYIDKKTDHRIYENIKDFLSADINNVYTAGVFYYVKTKAESMYDNCIWKTDKKTGAVSYMMFTEFILDYMDKTTEIDPSEFKRMIQEKY